MANVNNTAKTNGGPTFKTEHSIFLVEECEYVWNNFSAHELISPYLNSPKFPKESNSHFLWMLKFKRDDSEEIHPCSATISLYSIRRKIKTPVLSKIHFSFSTCGQISKQNDVLVSGEKLGDPINLAHELEIKAFEKDSLEIYVKISTKYAPVSSGIHKSYCQDYLDIFDKLWNNDEFTDVVIYADGGQTVIKAHRFVLSKCSEVFRAMFFNNMEGSNTGKITINDFDGSTIKRLLHFVYTQKVEFNEIDEEQKLLRAADKYDLPDLKSYCAHYLTISLSETNAISNLLLADEFNESNLKECALKYIVENKKYFKELHAFRSIREKKPELLEEIIFLSFSEADSTDF